MEHWNSAILTMFQIPNASDDPVTRTPAFMSLICALMSLLYGCIYIVRFGAMKTIRLQDGRKYVFF